MSWAPGLLEIAEQPPLYWQLLKAIETALRERLPLITMRGDEPYSLLGGRKLYRPQDIFISTAQNDLPEGAILPAVGIKDGSRAVEQGSCNTDNSTVEVEIIVWGLKVKKEPDQVMGSKTQPGVIWSEHHVETALRGDTLGGIASSGGWLLRSAPSEALSNKAVGGKEVQVRILTFQYILMKQWTN